MSGRFETDRQRLEQILRNLLSNAFKFTEQGKVELSIRRASDDQIALSVTDTGIGISEDQQKTVFEPFRQADGTISRKYGGTGLGLSISRELVRLLGGTLALRSAEGEGSTFTVPIPDTFDARACDLREPPAPTATCALEPPQLSRRPRAPVNPPRRVEDDRDRLTGGTRPARHRGR